MKTYINVAVLLCGAALLLPQCRASRPPAEQVVADTLIVVVDEMHLKVNVLNAVRDSGVSRVVVESSVGSTRNVREFESSIRALASKNEERALDLAFAILSDMRGVGGVVVVPYTEVCLVCSNIIEQKEFVISLEDLGLFWASLIFDREPFSEVRVPVVQYLGQSSDDEAGNNDVLYTRYLEWMEVARVRGIKSALDSIGTPWEYAGVSWGAN